jgi:hypothetical protein
MSADASEWEQRLDAIRSDGKLKDLAEYFRGADRFDFFTDTAIVVVSEPSTH